MNLNIDSSKEDVINFIIRKTGLTQNQLSKINEEGIDGEVLILLRKKDFNFLGIKKISDRNKILSCIEKDILKLTDKIKQNQTYKYINQQNLDDLWNSFDKHLEGSKLGEKLKFIKYLLLRDSPPKKDNINNLLNYFKKIFKNEEIINQIIDSLEDLLSFNEEEFEEQCSNWEFSKNDIYKLKIIIELIKQNKNNPLEEKSNIRSEENRIKVDNDTKINNENDPNLLELNIINSVNSIDDNYLLYSTIKVFKYETSQGEISLGLINPIDEFERICTDFKISYENECSFIDYNEAKQIKLSTFMLWGSAESLYQFFKENNIKEALSYFNKDEENQKNAGIYLCINICKKIGYLIIWPGNLNYQYSKLDEPNDNILLTLLRYGFSLSSNSIICLTKNEINNFDFGGYKIYEDIGNSGYEPERRKILINEIKEKKFELGKKNILIDGLKENLYDKKIKNVKFNHNCLIIYEEKGEQNISQNKTINFYEFLQKYSDYDLYFENSFDIKSNELYLLIQKKPYYFLKTNQKDKIYSKQSLKDIIEERLNKIIDDLFKKMNTDLFSESIYLKKMKCVFCKSSSKDEELYYGFNRSKKKILYHLRCDRKLIISKINKLNEKEYIHLLEYDLYKNYKDKIKKKNSIVKEKIEIFFENCEKKFTQNNKDKNTKIIDKTILNEEIENLKRDSYNYIIKNEQKIKELIGENEFNKYKSNFNYEELKKIWKEKINKYYKDNNNKIKKWVILKSLEYKKNKVFLSYELKEIKIKKEVAKLYKIKQYEQKQYEGDRNFNLAFSTELGNINEIENYFPSGNKGIIIYKNKDKFKIKEKIFEEFDLYNYDIISGTLALFRKEGGEQKIGIYYSNGESKNIYCDKLYEEKSILNKIMLIPCASGYEKQSLLLFINKQIHIIKLKDTTSYSQIIDLEQEFSYIKFEELQFIIYLDFLLILKFDGKNWNGKVFSLCLEDDSLFKIIKTIKLEMNLMETEFSIVEFNDKIYLFSISIINNENPLIFYWEIDSQLSGISTDCQIKRRKQDLIKEIPYGNCVINYFYHCFEKYPLLGAIQHNYKMYENNNLKISFYVEKNYINYFKNYLNELKRICESKKKICFDDINFSYIIDYKENLQTKDSSIGDLLIKFLELTPIQIAKIMGNEFKVMSNGENIEKKIGIETKKRNILKKETKINILDYSKMIDFCIKESIFAYFEFPVIVICCFGTQSIGKSTFLNELTGSLFNVSGMRCTEGIWMSIKLFNHSFEKEKINCNGNCNNCPNNKCCLLRHEICNKKIKCLCSKCKCDKNCLLKENNNYNEKLISCNSECCLKKGHENMIKCSVNECKCKCVCECICKNKNNHQHLCFECKKNNNKLCECECKCKHFCEIPILLHNFICVCLDFEGLGTFERTNEQDIQMALIGSAMGNSVIFRTGNSFDRFTENTLEKLALGSNKIKSINIQDFFGGSLFFSPKDVLPKDKDKLQKEFTQKIENSVKRWNYNISYIYF